MMTNSNPGQYQQDEVTREVQQRLLEMLLVIDDVCKKHGLRYYLIAGTMLGAVRHHGFVPWDDDADVALPRPDYEKLLEHADEWFPEQYELVNEKKDIMYPYLFSRLQDARTTYILRRNFNFVGGLPIDIFPIDGMTDNKWARAIHYAKYNFIKKLLYFSTVNPYKHGHGVRAAFPLLMHRLVSQSWAHRKGSAIQKEYDYDTSEYIADHDNKPERGIYLKDVFGQPAPVDFEGHQLMGVAKPDDYLRCCYGDYMQMPNSLPPQNYRFLDLSLPYRIYLQK